MTEISALFRATPGAASLLAAIIGIGAYTLMFAPGWIQRGVFRPFWVSREREYASLLTNGFLHADLPHLVFNAFTFWAFAFALERAMGSTPFLALYAVGLLVSDLGTWVRHRNDPGYRTLGASGAIMAVLFAAIVYAPTSAIYILPIPFPIPAPLFAVCYLAYTYYAARQIRSGINHDAHFAGALAGLGFVALTDPAAMLQALHRIGM